MAAAVTQGFEPSAVRISSAGPLVRSRRGSRRSRRRLDVLVTVALVLAVVVGGWAVLSHRSPAHPTGAGTAAPGPAIPSSPELEDRFGVRLTGAYVTADGGMVELTYQVLDADKAVAVHLDENSPVLVAGDIVFAAPGLAGHGHGKQEVAAGRSTFVLLANIGGTLEVGDIVTVRVGDISVDGVRLG